MWEQKKLTKWGRQMQLNYLDRDAILKQEASVIFKVRSNSRATAKQRQMQRWLLWSLQLELSDELGRR